MGEAGPAGIDPHERFGRAGAGGRYGAVMRRIWPVLFVSTLMLAACGGGDGDDAGSGSGAGGEPEETSAECEELGAEEVAEITGADISGESALPAGCRWSLADPGPTGSAAFDYQVLEAEQYESNLETAEATSSLEVETLDGIGDEAFWRLQVNTEGATINGELWVLDGDTGYQVRAQGIEYTDDVRDQQYEIATRIVGGNT